MIPVKTPEEIEIMAEGGRRLGRIKKALEKKIAEGVRASEIEALAGKLIEKEGGKPSFKMVPGYSWAICINVNEGLVHGIPKENIVFRKGDVVSVDIGMNYHGFHTDTSFTVAIDPAPETARFLQVGNMALEKAIFQVKAGNYIYNISEAIQKTVEAAGYSAIRALVGHGVGRQLHEEPQIPCFLPGPIGQSPKIEAGMVFAIEVMYALGSPDVVQLPDGWTIAMRDAKISGLFEETVVVTKDRPKVLTR